MIALLATLGVRLVRGVCSLTPIELALTALQKLRGWQLLIQYISTYRGLPATEYRVALQQCVLRYQSFVSPPLPRIWGVANEESRQETWNLDNCVYKYCLSIVVKVTIFQYRHYCTKPAQSQFDPMADASPATYTKKQKSPKAYAGQQAGKPQASQQ